MAAHLLIGSLLLIAAGRMASKKLPMFTLFFLLAGLLVLQHPVAPNAITNLFFTNWLGV